VPCTPPSDGLYVTSHAAGRPSRARTGLPQGPTMTGSLIDAWGLFQLPSRGCGSRLVAGRIRPLPLAGSNSTRASVAWVRLQCGRTRGSCFATGPRGGAARVAGTRGAVGQWCAATASNAAPGVCHEHRHMTVIAAMVESDNAILIAADSGQTECRGRSARSTSRSCRSTRRCPSRGQPPVMSRRKGLQRLAPGPVAGPQPRLEHAPRPGGRADRAPRGVEHHPARRLPLTTSPGRSTWSTRLAWQTMLINTVFSPAAPRATAWRCWSVWRPADAVGGACVCATSHNRVTSAPC